MNQKDGPKAGQQTKKVQSNGRTSAEWVTLVLSILILAVLIGFLAYHYFTTLDVPPAVSVDILTEQSYQQGGKFYVPVEVTNTGGQVAENVQIEVILSGRNVSTETGEFQLRFLSEGETSKGTVVFSQNPKNGNLESGVISFLTP